MERFDVAVVGAGAAGSAAARSIAEAGRSCVVLERFELGHAEGSSHGSARIFRLAYHHPDYVRMAVRARDAWRELESVSRTELLTTTGGIDIGPRAEEAADALEAAGVEHEWISGEEAEERWPALRVPEERVLFQPDAGVCAAELALETLVRLARAGGAAIRTGTEVEAVVPSPDGVDIRTRTGTLHADAVVVAAGGWNGPLLARADIPLPLSVTLEQVLYRERSAAPMPTVIEWTTPARYALGDPRTKLLKAGEHHARRVVAAEDRRHDVDAGSIERVSSWTDDRFRDAGAEASTETCLYTNTPDEDFVIDRVGPVIISSACSGHGFKFTPLIGRILADLAIGREPSVPLDRFRASRFRSAS
ncbi:MAG: N-methyl-L-tryptophan oxidase [Actinomycetota bacterium]